MADTKITALTALTAADPSTDVLPIVDTSDTTMAASGTTKKISINNILGASGTATLASATVTGDMTVRTNQLVVNSSGSFVGKSAGAVGTDGVQLLASGFSGFSASGTTALFVNRNTSDGTVLQLGRSGSSAADFGAIAGGGFTVGLSGSEWMRINSTGLGVGTSPSYKFHVKSDLSELYFRDNGTASELLINSETGGRSALYFGDVADIVRGGIVYESATDLLEIRGYNNAARLQIDSVGNFVSNVTGTAPTLSINSQMVFNLTSNTNLRISVRGTDGVTRTANITLA